MDNPGILVDCLSDSHTFQTPEMQAAVTDYLFSIPDWWLKVCKSKLFLQAPFTFLVNAKESLQSLLAFKISIGLKEKTLKIVTILPYCFNMYHKTTT